MCVKFGKCASKSPSRPHGRHSPAFVTVFFFSLAFSSAPFFRLNRKLASLEKNPPSLPDFAFSLMLCAWPTSRRASCASIALTGLKALCLCCAADVSVPPPPYPSLLGRLLSRCAWLWRGWNPSPTSRWVCLYWMPSLSI